MRAAESVEFVDISIGEDSFRAKLLDGRSPEVIAELRRLLPIEGFAFQNPWSGQLFEIELSSRPSIDALDTPTFFQHPGLMVLTRSGTIAVSFGEARFQDGAGPAPVFPLAQIGGDLRRLVAAGSRLSVEGASRVTIARCDDQRSPLEEAPQPRGRRVLVSLGSASATAVLLEETAPKATAAFAALLPLSGKATNTVWSGLLTRFWNSAGGPEGETPIEGHIEDVAQRLLYPAFIYYLPVRPWRGLRLSLVETTMMRGSISGGDEFELVALARFIGDWSRLTDEARKLVREGAKEMTIELKA